MNLLEWLDDQMARGADPVGIKGTLDALGVTAGRMGATAVGGYRGLYDYLTSDMTDEDLQNAINKIGQTVQAADDWMLPRTTEGFPQAMENFESVAQPVGEAWREYVSQPMGNMAYENAGGSPLAGALTQAAAEVLPHMLFLKRPTAAPAPATLPPEMRLDAPVPQLPSPPKPSFDPSRRQFLKDTATLAATPALSPILRAFPETPAPAVVEAAAPAVAEAVAPTLSNAGKTILDYALENTSFLDPEDHIEFSAHYRNPEQDVSMTGQLQDIVGPEFNVKDLAENYQITSYELPHIFQHSGAPNPLVLVGNDDMGYHLWDQTNGEFMREGYVGELYNGGSFKTLEEGVEAYIDGELTNMEIPIEELDRTQVGGIKDGIFSDIYETPQTPSTLPSVDDLVEQGITPDQFLANMLGLEGTPSAPSSVGNPLLDNQPPSGLPRILDEPSASRLPDFQPKPDVPFALKPHGLQDRTFDDPTTQHRFDMQQDQVARELAKTGSGGYKSKMRTVIADMLDKRAGTMFQENYDMMSGRQVINELNSRGISDEEITMSTGMTIPELVMQFDRNEIGLFDLLTELRPPSDRIRTRIESHENDYKAPRFAESDGVQLPRVVEPEERLALNLTPNSIRDFTRNNTTVASNADFDTQDGEFYPFWQEVIQDLPDTPSPSDFYGMVEDHDVTITDLPTLNWRTVGEDGVGRLDSSSRMNIIGNDRMGYRIYDPETESTYNPKVYGSIEEATDDFINMMRNEEGYTYPEEKVIPYADLDEMYDDQLGDRNEEIPNVELMREFGYWPKEEEYAGLFAEEVMQREMKKAKDDPEWGYDNRYMQKMTEWLQQQNRVTYDDAQQMMIDAFDEARNIDDFKDLLNTKNPGFSRYFDEKVAEHYGNLLSSASNVFEQWTIRLDSPDGVRPEFIIFGAPDYGYALLDASDNNRIIFGYGVRKGDDSGDKYDTPREALVEIEDRLVTNGDWEYDSGWVPDPTHPANNAPEFRGTGNVKWANSFNRVGNPNGNLYENVILTNDLSGYTNTTHFPDDGLYAFIRAATFHLPAGEAYMAQEIQSDIQSDARKAGGWEMPFQITQLEQKGQALTDQIDDAVVNTANLKTTAVDARNEETLLITDDLLYDHQRDDFYDEVRRGLQEYWERRDQRIHSGASDLDHLRFDTPEAEAEEFSRVISDLYEGKEPYPEDRAYSEMALNFAKGSFRRNVAFNISDEILVAFRDQLRKFNKNKSKTAIPQYPTSKIESYPPKLRAYADALWREQTIKAERAMINDKLNKYQLHYPTNSGFIDQDVVYETTPMKDANKWLGAMVPKAVERAIANGNDIVIFGNSRDSVHTWGDEFEEGYKNLYDEALPAELKKFGRKYGVEPKRIPVGDESGLKKGGDWRWGFEITPELKEAIEKYGIDLYSKVENPLLDRASSPQQIGGLLGMA